MEARPLSVLREIRHQDLLAISPWILMSILIVVSGWVVSSTQASDSTLCSPGREQAGSHREARAGTASCGAEMRRAVTRREVCRL
jgi:hypothetical protein